MLWLKSRLKFQKLRWERRNHGDRDNPLRISRGEAL
jgi:hypothetical protein